MLEQQKPPTYESIPSSINIATKINRIDRETNQLNAFLYRIRQRKTNTSHEAKSSQPHDSELSQIQMKSSKVSFDCQPADKMDRTIKRFIDLEQVTQESSKTKRKSIANRGKDRGKDSQEGIKIKPRFSINGRDQIKKESFTIYIQGKPKSSSKQDPTAIKTQNEEKHNKIKYTPTINNKATKIIHPALETQQDIKSHTNKFRTHLLNNQTYSQRKEPRMSRINNPPSKCIKKQQRLCRIIPQQLILKFIPFYKSINAESPPTQIYDYFTSLCQLFQIKPFPQPLIKRYRNCIYFGEKVPKGQQTKAYEGFVWYYRKAIYYGTFQAGKKHGQGVEIDLDKNNMIWKGTFEHGNKTGYFQVIGPKFKYHGLLKNGYYNGQGLLETEKSKFSGQFRAGQKHGVGEENFYHEGISYKGQYFEGNFEGEGELEADNYFYQGTFRKSTANGNGFQRTGQYQYVGEFKSGKKHGRGILKMKNGVLFEGLFREGVAIQENNRQREATFGNQGNKCFSHELHELLEQKEELTIEYPEENEYHSSLSPKQPHYRQICRVVPSDESNEEEPLQKKII